MKTNTGMNKGKIFRQGDVLLKRTSRKTLPGEPVERDKGRIILARGEVTGHVHAIHEKDVLLTEYRYGQANGFLEVMSTANLVHEEHDPVELDKGIYEVIQQREYSPRGVHDVQD